MPSAQKKQGNLVQKSVARFLPQQESKPIVTYVERGVDSITRRGMQSIVKENLHPLRSFGILMTVGTLCGLVSIPLANDSDRIEKMYHFNKYAPEQINTVLEKDSRALKYYNRKSYAEYGMLLFVAVSGASYLGSVSLIGGSLEALMLARRKRRGQGAASELFDEFLTNDGAINGVKLLPAMQEFFATQKLFDGNDDPAAISYIANGKASVDAILSIFEVDKSDILKSTVAKLNFYNDLPEGSSQNDYFPTLTAQFDDPKFIRALALGIFNGDEHQDLVDALGKYDDKEKLHEALVDLCTNATIVVDVIHKLQERIPDALPENIKELKTKLETGRHTLIKKHPEIAGGFGLELIPDADIDAVNAAFAALDISGVVHLPSQANDDNRAAQLEARFTALEAGTAATRLALNPGEQATMARLEREVHEGGR